MPQNRVWWAVTALGMKSCGSTGSYTTVHGLQSAGLTTKIDIRRIFELGQSETYENVEQLPDVEMTAEKVFDGYPILYHLATPGATSSSLLGRSNDKCTAAFAIFGDTQDSASGTPLAVLMMSGLFINSWSFEATTDGDAKESCSFIGNNGIWQAGTGTLYGSAFNGTLFDNTDTPLAVTGSGGVQQRENFIWDGASTSVISVLPIDIPGISSSGTNNVTAGVRGAHVQKVSVSADFGREAMLELGQRAPYHRYMNLPVEVKTDIEIMALSGHMFNVVDSSTTNTADRTIRVKLTEGLNVYLGTRNRLTNITQGGSDAGGGNATITYSYVNANSLTITHPQDPAGLS